MVGGILQLVAIGVDNLYLTGSPQITIFKIVYRRHTNFSLYTTSLRPYGSQNAGDEFIIKLENKGDLLYKINLVVDIPEIKLTFPKPTVQFIASILASYGISWSSSNPSTSIVLLSDYNNTIINSINNKIESNMLSYDYYNLQYARINNFIFHSITPYLDLIGTRFLLNNTQMLLQNTLIDISSNYLINHLLNNLSSTYTNILSYSDIDTYLTSVLVNVSAINVITNFINILLPFFITYVTNNTINVPISSYIDTFFTSNLTQINNYIYTILTTSSNQQVLSLININLTLFIKNYVQDNLPELTNIIEPFFSILMDTFILQFGSQVYDLTSNISDQIVNFFGWYQYGTNINVYQLLNQYSIQNDYNTSYIYLINQSVLSDLILPSIQTFLNINFISNSDLEILQLLQEYLPQLQVLYTSYLLSLINIAINFFTNQYLIYYTNNYTGSSLVTAYINTLGITSINLTTALSTYLSIMETDFVIYLGGIPTLIDVTNYLSTQNAIDLIIQTTNTIFINQNTIMALVITYYSQYVYYNVINYLEQYVNTTLTILDYIQNITQVISTSALYIYIAQIFDMFTTYLTSNSIITPTLTDISNFISANTTTLSQLSNISIMTLFIEQNNIQILLLQNQYVNVTNKNNMLSYLYDVGHNYLISYIDTNNTPIQFILLGTYLNVNNLILVNFVESYLNQLLTLFINTQYPLNLSNLSIRAINNNEMDFLFQQKLAIGILYKHFLESISKIQLNNLFTQSLTPPNISSNREFALELFSVLLTTGINNDDFIDPSNTNSITKINNMLFTDGMFFQSVSDNHTLQILYDGLFALYTDIATNNIFNNFVIRNGDFIRLLTYNYYVDHIIKNYDVITVPTYDITGLITNYVYPNPNYLQTVQGSNTFDPIYCAVKDNIVIYHIIDMNKYTVSQNKQEVNKYIDNIINGAYIDYINSALLNLNSYKSTDSYITHKKYIERNGHNINLDVISQLLDNIYWNNLLNFAQIKQILNFIKNNIFYNSNHFRIGLYKLFNNVNNVYTTNNIFNSISESIYNELNDNIIKEISNININTPNNVINFFQNELLSEARKFISECQDILLSTKYNEYFNDFSLWQNLLIDTINVNTTLSSRLSQSNSTINGQTPNYLIFGPEYTHIALMNYIPYLVVNDVPYLINAVLATTPISFLPSTDILFQVMLDYFNLLDGDENTSNTFSALPGDLALKLYMYETITQLVIFNNLTIIDDDFIVKMKDVYAPNTSNYLLSSLFRPEGLFYEWSSIDDMTNIITNNGQQTELPIDWICNTYITRFITKITNFITTNYSTQPPTIQTLYINELTNIIQNAINSFRTKHIPDYKAYVNNGYTMYNITSITSYITNTSPFCCDAISSIWYHIQKKYIKEYNLLINDIALSKSYYNVSLGSMAGQIYTQMQTQFINVNTIFDNNSILQNFDTFGKAFLNASGLDILLGLTQLGQLINTYLNIPQNPTNQYEIMVYQYLYGLTDLYLKNYSTLLNLSPTLIQIAQIIDQFYNQQRDLITDLEIFVLDQNLNLFKFGKGFIMQYDVNNNINTNIAKFTNGLTSIGSYGYYIGLYLTNLYTLYTQTTNDINDFFPHYYAQIEQIIQTLDPNSTNILSNIIGFNMAQILALNSVYNTIYINNVTNNYNFYKLSIATSLANPWDQLIQYVDDLNQYYLTIYDNYSIYKQILNVRHDSYNIKTNLGTITKQIYFFDTIDNINSDFGYHVIYTYVTPNPNSTVVTYLTSIVNDTVSLMTQKYIGVMDVINSNNQLIPNSNLYSIRYLFSLISSPNNPFDPINYGNLSTWFNRYQNDPSFTQVNSTLTSIINTISSMGLYVDKNIISLYNSYKTYLDIITYIAYKVIKLTPLNFLIQNLININAQPIDTTLFDIMTIIKNNMQMYLDNILKITKINAKHNINHYKHHILHIYDTNDIIFYDISKGIPAINVSLETLLLNTIMQYSPMYAWVKELGHKLIESVTLRIGGQEIEQHNSDLLHLMHELYDDKDQERGYNIMIGNTREMHTLDSHNFDLRSITKLFIPLRFWFCRQAGTALPLIAMIYTKAEIKIKFSKLEDILLMEQYAQLVKKPTFRCHGRAEYIYLDEEERYKIAESKMEYLIDRFLYIGKTLVTKNDIFRKDITMVYTNSDSDSDIDNSDDFNKDKLIIISLNGIMDPTKYLLWTIKIKDPLIPHDIINWTDSGYNDYNRYPLFDQVKIRFNGRDREKFKEETYYTNVTPWSKYAGSLQDGEYMYSFALLPILLQPSGTANMSQIEETCLVMKPSQTLLNLFKNNNITLSVDVWNCTYNIFRVMSGMTGLLFYHAQ